MEHTTDGKYKIDDDYTAEALFLYSTKEDEFVFPPMILQIGHFWVFMNVILDYT